MSDDDLKSVMPDRLMYGNEGNYPLPQLLMGAESHFKDLQKPQEQRRHYPGEYLFGYRLPVWQRPAVWTEGQQARFIESCWLGFDIGRFVVARHQNKALDNLLIDGQQRLTALRDYLENRFPVFGYHWSELNDLDHRKFHRLNLPFAVVDADRFTEQTLIDIYIRLNYGGTAHAPEHHPDLLTP